jgi:hypothetical protein
MTGAMAAANARPARCGQRAGGNTRVVESVIASEAKQSIAPQGSVDCFVAFAPLRKRFAFVAGNDG